MEVKIRLEKRYGYLTREKESTGLLEAHKKVTQHRKTNIGLSQSLR